MIFLFYTILSQNEAKMQTLAENVKEVEAKKRKLEEAVDTLNERLANQTAKGKLHKGRVRSWQFHFRGHHQAVLRMNQRRCYAHRKELAWSDIFFLSDIRCAKEL